tara:strand:+ start:69 stop:236 length:168 start_codon:yes stop_codon:yes gene_type:complete
VENLSKIFVENSFTIISNVGGGGMEAPNEEAGKNKRFDAIAKYSDYSSKERINFS